LALILLFTLLLLSLGALAPTIISYHYKELAERSKQVQDIMKVKVQRGLQDIESHNKATKRRRMSNTIKLRAAAPLIVQEQGCDYSYP
jgi:hypothetical protein